MGFSRPEYWSGLPFPSPGDLPDPGIKSWSPALQADSLSSKPPGKPFAESKKDYKTQNKAKIRNKSNLAKLWLVNNRYKYYLTWQNSPALQLFRLLLKLEQNNRGDALKIWVVVLVDKLPGSSNKSRAFKKAAMTFFHFQSVAKI